MQLVTVNFYRRAIQMFKIAPSNTREIRIGDDDFYFKDNLTVCPRAAIIIADDCPSYTRTLLAKAINDGDIIPVAYVPGNEFTWQKLSEK